MPSPLSRSQRVPPTAPVRDLFAGMNGTERQRAIELEAMKRSGQIVNWWYEGMTFLLAPGLRFTPDFLVQELNGAMRVEETKGFMRDDALVKIKMFASLYPFPLRVLVLRPKKRGGGWEITDYGPSEKQGGISDSATTPSTP